ncbi:hypothetical protein PoB_006382500 [Plakobranchus ocellatus]|uniref:Uncharacterized protein n=1 Tax=Plakobranchus ocellatus TaxID=259542 RepID=A0AAV4CZU9_9GAST|nr:hypothetical protein PoB_006382500 [Plakobranchus ocellatus]
MKNFVKALNKDGQAFLYLRQKFPTLSDAKVKEGIFIGPQIKAMLKDEVFLTKMTPVESEAWNAFKTICENFLGNKKDPNYKELVSNLLSSYQQLGARMSLKSTSCTIIWIFSLLILGQCQVSTEKDFTSIFRKWRETIRVDGIQPCWVTSVGCLKEAIPKLNTSAKQGQSCSNVI